MKCQSNLAVLQTMAFVVQVVAKLAVKQDPKAGNSRVAGNSQKKKNVAGTVEPLSLREVAKNS